MRFCDLWGVSSLLMGYANSYLETSSSLVTLLSSSGNYSNFLYQLQRSDLIDYVNELENVTLLAPQNIAFDNGLVLMTKLKKPDLQKLIINQPLWEEDIQGTMLFDTLLNSTNEHGDQLPMHVPILMKKSGLNETWYIENSHVIDQMYSPTTNARLLGIDSFLQDPKLPICSYFSESLDRDTSPRHFTKFAQLISSFDSCEQLGIEGGNFTVLIPADSSLDINTFNDIEWNYLTSVESFEDRNGYLANYFVKGIIGGNLHNNVIKAIDLNDNELSISSKYTGDVMKLIFNHNGTKVESTQANYLLNDGILHYFENDLFVNTDRYQVSWTPRKYLLGLDEEDFVRELDFKSLGNLINDATTKQTIFVTFNDEPTMKAQSKIKDQLLYHFADKFDPLSIENPYMLLDSLHCKGGDCQKIRVALSDGKVIVNDKSATVMEPVHVGSTTIYVIDDELELPLEFKVALTRRKTGYARSANLIQNLGLSGQQTVLLPHTGTWEELGLVWTFLKTNPDKLESILKGFILNARIYTDFEGALETTNEADEKVVVQAVDGKSLRLIYHMDNGHSFESEIPIDWDNEIIYQNGVIHTLPEPSNHYVTHSNLPWSPHFEVTLTDILSTQNYIEFSKALELMNLSHVLNPENGYSILLPPSKSLENANILTWDPRKLHQFISFHVLPPGSISEILNCTSAELISTIDPDLSLQCRKLTGGEIMLSIADGSDREVRVLQMGLSFPYQSQGVLVLDKFIDPEWLNTSTGIHLHLSWLALLIGIIIGVFMVIFFAGACLVAMVGKRKIDEDPETQSSNSNDRVSGPLVTVNEQMPLLPGDNNDATKGNYYVTSTSRVPIPEREERSFSSEYSQHAQSHPVRIGYASQNATRQWS